MNKRKGFESGFVMVVGLGGECCQNTGNRNIMRDEKEYPLRWEL
jgi:hypothetical protein